MENEEDYVRVVPRRSGNNRGNKIKLWTGGIAKNRARETGQGPFSWKIKREGEGGGVGSG